MTTEISVLYGSEKVKGHLHEPGYFVIPSVYTGLALHAFSAHPYAVIRYIIHLLFRDCTTHLKITEMTIPVKKWHYTLFLPSYYFYG